MFDSIQSNSLAILYRTPVKAASTIPNGYALISVQRLWAMLCWIYDAFIDECEEYSSREIYDILAPYDDFAIHNTSRIISYTIHTTLLEGILIRMYKDMCFSLRERVDPSIATDEAAMDKRKDEVRDVRTFRNKIAAHTSYAYPDRDTKSTQWTSLETLLSGALSGNRDPLSFNVGAMKVHFEGEPPETKIPTIGLYSIHSAMIKHFEAWEKMFRSKLQSAKTKLPIETSEYRIRTIMSSV